MLKYTPRPPGQPPAFIPQTPSPAALDRLADLELAHGRHAAAEHLANRAAEIREMAP